MDSNAKWMKRAAITVAGALVASAVSTQALAGRVVIRDGRYVAAPLDTTDVARRHTDVLYVVVRAGAQACVRLSSDGDSALHLFVYDDRNNLICMADSLGADEQCRFTPHSAGPYRVRYVTRARVTTRS